MVLDNMGQTRDRDHMEKRISVPELALKVLKLPGVNVKLDKPKSRQPSKKLQQIVYKIGSTFMTLEDTIIEALELGRKEGFTDIEIGDMIRAEFKRINRPRMTLARYLPVTAKHMEKARTKSDFGNKMLPNRPVAISTENETLPSTDTTTVATKSKQQQRPGKWNQDPLEYDVDNLDQYDIEYLHLAVKGLHQLRMDFIKEGFKWQTRFDDMKREKAALQRENAELKAENERLKRLT
jgi:hypothetical protein